MSEKKYLNFVCEQILLHANAKNIRHSVQGVSQTNNVAYKDDYITVVLDATTNALGVTVYPPLSTIS